MTRHCARAVFVLLCVAGISLWAQGREENRVIYWAAADLQSAEMKELTPQAKAATNGVGAKTFMNLQTHKVMMAHREKPGVPTAQDRKGAVQAPMFEVDPLWPKPLPNHWVLGS